MNETRLDLFSQKTCFIFLKIQFYLSKIYLLKRKQHWNAIVVDEYTDH